MRHRLIQSRLCRQIQTFPAWTSSTVIGPPKYFGERAVSGGGGSDTVYGSRAGNVLAGGHGPDTLFGRKGKDQLFGEGSHDELRGGVGHDQLSGGKGHDELFGGGGNDLLVGGPGYDVLSGGVGDDWLVVDKFDTWIDGGAGFDTIVPTINTFVFTDRVADRIDAVDLREEGAKVLVVDADELDASTDDGVLFVRGDAGDAVTGDGWSGNGVRNIDGQDYAAYTAGGIELLIQDGLMMNGDVIDIA